MNDNNSGGGKPNGNDNKNRQPFYILGLLVLIALFFTSMMYKGSAGGTQEVTYSEFLEMVENDQVESVVIDNSEIEITLKDEVSRDKDSKYYSTAYGKTTYYTAYLRDDDLLPTMKAHGVDIDGKIPDSTAAIVYNILSFVIPMVILWILLGFLMKKMGGGPMGVGKSNAKIYNMEKTTGVTFKDVAGQDEAKESLQEVVDFLHNPKKYKEIGAKIPKGAH